MRLKLTILMALITAVSSGLIAAEPAFVISSIRQKAMGGAGVAIVKDESAVYVNPAAISEIGFKFNLLRIRADLNQDAIDKFSDLTTLSSSFGSDKDQTEQLTKINSLIPARFGVNLAGMGPSFGLFGFFIAGGAEAHAIAELVRPTSPTLKASILADGQYGIGHDFQVNLFGQDMMVGGAVKTVMRYRTYDASDGGLEFSMGTGKLLDAMNSGDGQGVEFDTATGSGVGFDLGFKSKMATFLGDTSAAVVFNNIGTTITGTKTVSGNESVFSATIPMTTTLGLGFSQDLFLLGSTSFAVDYKIQPDSTLFKSVYMGFEKTLWLFTLRGGLYQGYPTVGLGMDLLWIFHGNYAYYTEETGGEAGSAPLSYHLVELGLHF